MLKRLDILNFRILQDLHVDRLGQVNLIVGKNNAGKSTVLESIRIFAGNSQRRLLEDVAREHDERFWTEDPNPKGSAQRNFNFDFIFYDPLKAIFIGDSTKTDQQLLIENVLMREFQETFIENGVAHPITRRRRVDQLDQVETDEPLRRALAITKNNRPHYILLDTPLRTARLLDQEPILPCGVVPTRFVYMDELAQAWDKVVFSDDESLVKEAIKYIAPDFEALTFIDMDDYDPDRARTPAYTRQRSRRVPVVKMTGSEGPDPLRRLGDGVSRILQLALKLVQSKGGYLLIDEFENGFHYTVQETIWDFVFRAASSLNIQVFATTHSWDCVKCFAQASQNARETDALLFRVGKSVRKSDAGKIIATEFFGDDLLRVKQSDLEVR